MKKNIWFVQPSWQYASDVYIPYATGCLAAYAWDKQEICDNYKLAGFIYKRENIDIAVKKIIKPYLVAFSCNIWSQEYDNALAALIKKTHPNCIIVYGGHNISQDVSEYNNNPYVDYLIEGEGEIPFYNLLNNLLNNHSCDEIDGIYTRTNFGASFICKNRNSNLTPLDSLPSPYLSGVFDTIIKNGDNFACVLETNRGCPYKCSYCNWCFTEKLRLFPIEKIKKEIEWFSNHKIDYFFCADSNFGINKRDLEIAKHITRTKEETGYPCVMGASYSKESNERVFEISKIFYKLKINKAATLSVQSMNDSVLYSIGRKNLSEENFSLLSKKYNSFGIPTYTDLILGLPNETFDSFSRGLCDLLEMGQHNAISVYYCQVYPNTLLSEKTYQKKYGIKTAKVKLNRLHASVNNETDIPEYCTTITETSSMNRDDLKKSVMFSTMIQCFHHIGLLKYIAVYLHNKKNISYYNFYSKLFRFIFNKKNTIINKIFTEIMLLCDTSLGEWTYSSEKFGNTGWFLDEGAFLELIFHFEEYKRDILYFLSDFLDLSDIEEKNLVNFQFFAIRTPKKVIIEKNFDYDFLEYFKTAFYDSQALLSKRNIKIRTTENELVKSWQKYSELIMLFAKRRGATILFNDEKNYTIEY